MYLEYKSLEYIIKHIIDIMYSCHIPWILDPNCQVIIVYKQYLIWKLFLTVLTFETIWLTEGEDSQWTTNILVCSSLYRNTLEDFQNTACHMHNFYHLFMMLCLLFEAWRVQLLFIAIAWKRATSTFFKIFCFVLHRKKIKRHKFGTTWG